MYFSAGHMLRPGLYSIDPIRPQQVLQWAQQCKHYYLLGSHFKGMYSIVISECFRIPQDKIKLKVLFYFPNQNSQIQKAGQRKLVIKLEEVSFDFPDQNIQIQKAGQRFISGGDIRVLCLKTYIYEIILTSNPILLNNFSHFVKQNICFGILRI